jgi:hypothetical protein
MSLVGPFRTICAGSITSAVRGGPEVTDRGLHAWQPVDAQRTMKVMLATAEEAGLYWQAMRRVSGISMDKQILAKR